MRVAIVGASGQLGMDLVQVFTNCRDEVCALTHADVELCERESVAGCLSSLMPSIVVNAAAMHHVENCEAEPERAFAVNALGGRNLALVSHEIGAVLVQISTDYVFDGQKGRPYVEEDAPLPLNVYGNSKLASEYFVRTINPKHYVLRTSALYGKNPCRAKGGRNFVDLMLKVGRERGRVRVVDTEIVSPTSTAQLAAQVRTLCDVKAYGLYHATSEGSCSWYEFAREIFAQSNMAVDVQRAGPDEFPAKVSRPKYSVLENANLKRFRVNQFTPWQDGLREYLAQVCTVAS
jgi:dTDP-4-dehydrorhamnose reductase